MTMQDKDLAIARFIIALLGVKGIGPKKIIQFLNTTANNLMSAGHLDADYIESLYQAGDTKGIESIYSLLLKAESTWEEQEERADRIIEASNSANIHILHPLMKNYPQRLLRNKSYPPVLFCKGNLAALNHDKSVAMIGTRNPSNFGMKMGYRLAEILVEDGYAIVSGLALGCDTVGHEGALDAGGITIAVLPTSLDKPVYPRQNQLLASRILDNNGVLVSEYAPGIEISTRQLAGNLVARDEWQPGMADGVIAIETSVTGGTNHAMRHAIKTGTPIAVFDYTSRSSVEFAKDERFSGNVDYLAKGAIGIFEESTIREFERKMEEYRCLAINSDLQVLDKNESEEQLSISFE